LLTDACFVNGMLQCPLQCPAYFAFLSFPVVLIFEIVLSKFAFSLDLPKIEKT